MEHNVADAARIFCRERLAPLARTLDEEWCFPTELTDEMNEIGILGAGYPSAFGGRNCDAVASYRIIEDLGKASAGVSLTVHVHWMAVDILMKFGSDEQKSKYLPQLLSGGKIGAFCVSEMQAGSDAASIKAEAVKTETGWALNGPKWFCTNGGLADIYLIGFKSDPEAGSKGISMFILEKGMPGFNIGDPQEKMGCRSALTTDLRFEDCVVPDSAMVGKENQGFKVVMHALNAGRLGMAAMGLGIAEAAFDTAVEHANKRVAFGKPLIALYSIQEKIARMHVQITATRMLVETAARKRESGDDYSLESSVAKISAAETVNLCCHESLQTFGGHGYMKYNPIERIARDGRLLDIGVGASEVLKMIVGGIVARQWAGA